jgi:hypothetical protein
VCAQPPYPSEAAAGRREKIKIQTQGAYRAETSSRFTRVPFRIRSPG